MRNRKFMAALVIASFIGIAMTAGNASADRRHRWRGHHHWRDVRVDISQNMASFVADEAPLLDNGFPAYGNAFIIEGYLYPEGTLDESGNGVLPNGEPEYPDLVIGHWTCRGWFVGNGMGTVSGPWVISHQLYDLGDEAGSQTITTDGYEIVDAGVSVSRAITGGTGWYRKARGEQTQTNLGFNASGALNIRARLRVK